MPPCFYRHIFQGKNFLYLNGKNVLQLKVVEIITDFVKENENNYKELRNNLSSYKNVFHYVYVNVFPEIYCSTEKKSFSLKSNFHIIFKRYKDKKNLGSLLEEKPLKPTNIFNKVEEKVAKEKIEKRKQKRREVAEQNKLFKKKNKIKKRIR